MLNVQRTSLMSVLESNNTKYNSYYDYKVDDINTLIYNLSNNK
jgi:hypothetical protein